MWYRKVFKVGGSLHVGLPARVCEVLEIYAGDHMLVFLSDDGILIKKSRASEILNDKMAKTKKQKGGRGNG